MTDQTKLYYTVDLSRLKSDKRLFIAFYRSVQNPKSKINEINPAQILGFDPDVVKDRLDRQVLSLIFGLQKINDEDFNFRRRFRPDASVITVEAEFISPALYALVNTGRLFRDLASLKKTVNLESQNQLGMDSGAKFSFELFVSNEGAKLRLQGRFRRGKEIFPLLGLNTFPEIGYILIEKIFYSFEPDQDALSWMDALHKFPNKFVISESEIGRFLETVLNGETTVELPNDLKWPVKNIKPGVRALFHTEADGIKRNLLLKIEFDYSLRKVSSFSNQKFIVDSERNQIFKRNTRFEQETLEKITSLGAENPLNYQTAKISFIVPFAHFLKFVQTFQEYGWVVEAEGKKVRTASDFNMKVSSGVDWFDLEGTVGFDGVSANLPALLSAVQRQDQFIILDDGTVGMLPTQWLEKYAPLTTFSSDVEGPLRFNKSQAVLLDTWIREEKHVEIDADFKIFRKKLRKFEGLKFQQEPESFRGKLRAYQREGLSWLSFLEEFGFGGILADDMGLGKTIQCLAFLEGRRKKFNSKKGKLRRTSIVVAPKSLIFNWIDEAQKFTPGMKILNYTGFERERSFKDILNYDLMVTTYQTLRIDIEKLKEIEFDYAVIDEAQAVKNEDAQITKATRLIKASHRLAMTGTPVENSLTDLFSIAEFSNPGLLGRKAFEKLIVTSDDQGINDAALKNLSLALKPFILRRTKTQVLKELPRKTEQVITLELLERQRQDYDELKLFFKLKLDEKIKQDGYKKSQFQVLTALLRLRQAALHPGLIDKSRINEPSVKLNALVEQLSKITSEGHKALVFSQFTSFLAIVKTRFHEEGIKYQYIDGQTKNRKSIVDAFKADPECKVFLMSLKAGGVGLNLTEADYVFLMDPWWNPAVEAQAIDRVHRIGQKNKVFAYKLIAKDTVEEKILELQKSKKHLAHSVISTDQGFLKSMTAQDLAVLLS